MSHFPNKQFEGALYTFDHLRPVHIKLALNADQSVMIDLHISFGCHCFTEAFDVAVHRPDHRYTYRHETRAFNPLRYACSLQLGQVVRTMLKGKIYNARESYTYTTQVSLASTIGPQSYSIFFNLERDKGKQTPTLRMFVKSAYVKALVAKPHAQSWRFVSLAGQIAGVFASKEKNPKPAKKNQKKKAP
ncbi:hypothetical protein FHW67_004160 [Herbaspirillum sp. Sphag1AN]|uniref:hypothetical protein n=1 Tax=unclassified Herbaspirillum TaxID=2624150 RepID=UPI0016116F49|nr:MULTISPECIES: hypothetical protein [unclassified Herbaspirillum]MBB3214837.1 hypothetical protein [Herbaspirillum sp. Sphag1AN]MBB3248031.1 hypothetical protein [Herbaspirillum sp. Sphag64]